ncbi:MAG: hypothetical protein IT209_05020 [Armatimonadetes bacterium]|nr:hypothetical protein [Armatimonadota bacterium]
MSKLTGIALLGAAMAAVAAPSHADQTQLFTFNSVKSGTKTATISVEGSSKTVYVGLYNGTLGSLGVDVFCTDVRHAITFNQSYTTLALLGQVTDPAAGLYSYAGNYYYSSGPANAPVGAGMASALIPADYKPSGSLSAFDRSVAVAYLTDTYLTTAQTSVDVAAAVQMAMWDIITDGGDGLGSGYFTSSAGVFGAKSVQTYITEALGQSPTSTFTQWIQAPRTAAYAHAQDFVYKGATSVTITQIPVPEPAFFQLGALVGMGGLGLFRVRVRSPRAA